MFYKVRALRQSLTDPVKKCFGLQKYPVLFSFNLNRVYSFSYFKYGIYKPREVKKIVSLSDFLTSLGLFALVSLSDFFYLPRFINPIFKIGEKHTFLYRIFFTSLGL